MHCQLYLNLLSFLFKKSFGKDNGNGKQTKGCFKDHQHACLLCELGNRSVQKFSNNLNRLEIFIILS